MGCERKFQQQFSRNNPSIHTHTHYIYIQPLNGSKLKCCFHYSQARGFLTVSARTCVTKINKDLLELMQFYVTIFFLRLSLETNNKISDGN